MLDIKVVLNFLMTLLFIVLFLFVLTKGIDRRKSRVFSLFILNMAFWSFGVAMFYLSNSIKDSLFWSKFVYVFGGFIPPSFLYYALMFSTNSILNPQLIFFIYFPSLILYYLYFYTSLMIENVVIVNGYKVFLFGKLHILWEFVFSVTFFIAFLKFVKLYNNSFGIVKEHTKYIFLGTFFGVLFASISNVILPLTGNCKYVWLGPSLTLTWLLCITYTLIKHKLLDVRVVVSNTSIFISLYALVLGVPFFLYYKDYKFISLVSMCALATIAPFIYIYIRKKAEDRILIEQRRYQATLRQASSGMGKIKDLKKLLNMIVYVLTRSVRIEHACIYIKDNQSNQYIIGAQKKRFDADAEIVKSFNHDSYFVRYLESFKSPIIVEEVKQHLHGHLNNDYKNMEQLLNDLNAELVFPIFIDKELVAIVIMGKKETGKLYTEDDLSVFTILANQASLAIENAQFYEDMKRTQQQLFQAEKMATIGTMADGLSHQINNRFHALGFIAGDALDTINISREQHDPIKLKETISDLENALKRVQDNVTQGGEIVQGMLRYTRKGDASFTAINVDAVLKAAVEMTQFKIKTHELKIIKDYDPEQIPKVQGNFTQLQEVFFNMIDNAYDAMMQRKNEIKEEGFQPTLHIAVALLGYNKVEIVFEDNGIGVKETDMQKLFTPFFTTKLSSKKGTGLGLYVIKKIIEDNHGGGVDFSSKYLVGTRMKLTLPLATS